MKHLRRYNEAVYGVKGVEEFCANYLANLLDNDDYGFNIRETMKRYKVSPSYTFLFFCNYNFIDIIEWNSVKDHVITFLYMLNKYYNIINSSEDQNYVLNNSLSIQPNMVNDIINDNNFTIKNGRYGGSFRDDKLLRKIKIKVDFKEQSITEAVDNDTIDLCCVDLYDQGFELKGYKYNLISLQKQIVSDMPEWDGTQGKDVRGDIMWKEHLSKYQPCNITIKGKNFNQVSVDSRAKCVWDRTKQLPFTEEEKELVSKVSDIASILSHYNGTERKEKLVEININSRPSQNPVNFQYEKYLTRIDIKFYL